LHVDVALRRKANSPDDGSGQTDGREKVAGKPVVTSCRRAAMRRSISQHQGQKATFSICDYHALPPRDERYPLLATRNRTATGSPGPRGLPRTSVRGAAAAPPFRGGGDTFGRQHDRGRGGFTVRGVRAASRSRPSALRRPRPRQARPGSEAASPSGVTREGRRRGNNGDFPWNRADIRSPRRRVGLGLGDGNPINCITRDNGNYRA
jgi:hypothetical protein